MKIQNRIILLTLSITGFAFSQSTFPTNGDNAGIGTSTPNEKLEIIGSHTDARLGISYKGTTDATNADLRLWASEPNLTYTGVGIGNNATNGLSGITRVNTVRGGSYIRLLDNAINFNTLSSTGIDRQLMRMDVNGNIGIGTPAPASKLDVYSETDLGIRYNGIRTHRPGVFGQFSFMDYTGDAAIFGSSYTGAAGSYGRIHFRQYSQNNVFRDALVIDSAGDVGIGTATPSAKLHIDGLNGSEYFLQLGNRFKVKGDGVLTW
jgi:hypothetical protein